MVTSEGSYHDSLDGEGSKFLGLARIYEQFFGLLFSIFKQFAWPAYAEEGQRLAAAVGNQRAREWVVAAVGQVIPLISQM
jgi:hypothetical protein